MKAKVYKKGQIVLPKPFRDFLNIKPGDYVNIEMEKDFVKVMPVGKSIMDIAGSLKSKVKGRFKKNAVEEATMLEAKEVANEGKSN